MLPAHILILPDFDAVHKMEDDGELRQKVHKLERTLVAKLTEFLSSDTVYSIRKIMSAELAHIYYGPASGEYVYYQKTDCVELFVFPGP